MKGGAGLLLAATALSSAGACARPAEADPPRTAGDSPSVLVTLVPAGKAGPLPFPRDRFPPGSRIVLAPLDGAGPRVPLSDGLAAAGGARLSWDGTRVVFVARETEDAPFAVFTCASDGSDRRRAVTADLDCGGADLLPDGRIVYSAQVEGPAPRAGAPGPFALFVAAGDGTPGRRITFSAGCDLDPAVLRDGRIAYACWTPGAAGDAGDGAGGTSLFAVHPDGTGAALLAASPRGVRDAVRPRPGPDGALSLVGVGADGIRAAARVDRAAPFDPAEPVPGTGGVVCAEPLGGGRVLVGGRGGLRIVDASTGGAEGPFLGDPAWEVADVCAATPRPRPQGHLSVVDEKESAGSLLALDARPAGVAAASARILAVEAPFVGAGRPAARALGDVPLAADGSFFVRVPADRPLLLDLVDADGAVVAAGRTPFWVRPNESRACIGCHETPDSAPPNRRPAAVLRDPVDLSRTGEAQR